jgi:hypothetical protein
MIKTMMKASGDKRLFISLPGWICAIWAKKIYDNLLTKGFESGLNYGKLMTQIQNKKFYLDGNIAKQQLNYADLGFSGGKDVVLSIEETIKSCFGNEKKV